MPITEQDYRNRHLNTNPVSLKRPINERLLQQAAVDASLLVGHPGWDRYLERLQAELDQAQHQLDDCYTKVVGAYTDADLRLVQGTARELTGKITTLKWCMGLPTELVKEATDHGLLTGHHD